MLKNISNNVKCVKVRYAKDSTFLSLFLRCLFGLSWNYERGNGDNSTALFSLKYLFYIPNEQTQHTSDHTPVAQKKRWQLQYQFFLSQWFSSVTQYPSNHCPWSESRHEKNNSTGANRELLMWVFDVIIPKSVSGPAAAAAKKETLASVFRVEQLKHGKLSAFTNSRKEGHRSKVIHNHRVRTKNVWIKCARIEGNLRGFDHLSDSNWFKWQAAWKESAVVFNSGWTLQGNGCRVSEDRAKDRGYWGSRHQKLKNISFWGLVLKFV